MDPAGAFRVALEAGDVATLRRLHSAVLPHLPAPKTGAEAEITMHMARTATEGVTPKARYWSHRWLEEHGYPSQLPDPMRPSAERMYPRAVEGVGISVNLRSPVLKPAVPLITKAMSDVVEDMYANGDTQPGLVRGRMFAAKDDEMRRLFGGVIAPRE